MSDDVAVTAKHLSRHEMEQIDLYWRAANYLTVGQIYLLDNPLLRKPLKLEHVKPRLLGHWGTSPGLSFVYAHLNRIIRKQDANIIYICGPGHGGPAMVANAYLEGSYASRNPDITRNEKGMHKLFRQFSFPGGIPSHAAPDVPGSINEGGELGIHCLMPSALLSTIRILSSRASSVMGKPKPDRLPQPGIPTSS